MKPTPCTYPDCAQARALTRISQKLQRTAMVAFLLTIMISVWTGFREVHRRQLEVENMKLILIIRQLAQSGVLDENTEILKGFTNAPSQPAR